MAVSFIGGGNQSTQRKPQTCHKSLTLYHILLYRVHIVWAGFELTMLVVIGTDCIGSYKSTYNTITTAINYNGITAYKSHLKSKSLVINLCVSSFWHPLNPFILGTIKSYVKCNRLQETTTDTKWWPHMTLCSLCLNFFTYLPKSQI